MSVVWLRVCCDGGSATCWTGYYSGVGWYVELSPWMLGWGYGWGLRRGGESCLSHGEKGGGGCKNVLTSINVAHGAACIYGISPSPPHHLNI
jgi:hypothetical protein